MTIGIIGSGALGLYYGALLQRAGHEVRFLLRRDFDAITRKGLSVSSPKGDFHLDRVKGFRDPAEMGTVDLALVGLKTFANQHLVALLAPLMGPMTRVLTLQNGLGNEELLAEAFGAERVLGGVAFLCSNRGQPGFVHHLDQGRIRLGEFSGGLSPFAESLAESFRQAAIPCEAVADLRKARWEKLVWNIPFNGLCALTGQTTEGLLAHAPLRAEVRALMEEVIRAANAQNLSTPIAPDFAGRMIDVTASMGAYRPSMMIDRQEQRPLELDAIYALPLARAAEKGVEMVRVRMLHALLDAGEKTP
ncbi:ketopantoate reductase [Geoalkalibacter ferrihydriticus]|uniref:2-dehydropantoate 2-reductase n=2 Tax=Geoalkalibacter ferrihydriticus TaxID=392333 RepID=A0A0C2HL19_9BACT|nr:putative 2-dehydropantoate 2-reductase [Geoalkalibacter ferrihydriticus]KIH77761.1 2-dehydropantoate 2-reductase [Geoalkalibacter ferrihydriticus DSM 17813]SDL77654.1 ketopantoate reductase [Geoalkalibacter ferrihydriticus]